MSNLIRPCGVDFISVAVSSRLRKFCLVVEYADITIK